MTISSESIIRILTASALSGLLLTVGLRLRVEQIVHSLRGCRLGRILAVNFIVVPALVLGLAVLFRVEPPLAMGMILLGAAPFAPVVPVFARLARADLALAAGLTSVVPLFCAVLTPLICLASFRAVPGAGAVAFRAGTVVLTLFLTVMLPLGVGVALNHWAPALGQWLLAPVEKLGEVTGALSLTYVTVTEFGAILQTGWGPLAAMVLGSELSLLLGYWAGSGPRISRRVVALGTSNRNIALALLVAIASFPGTRVVPAVVANGFLLILLGLAHVGYWRFVHDRRLHAS